MNRATGDTLRALALTVMKKIRTVVKLEWGGNNSPLLSLTSSCD
ncbi:MAG: hypothetical protein OYH77_02125 [Pseudomonadota bacterium]|nr:hypothetical protein [Pseudomonadota bacterium]